MRIFRPNTIRRLFEDEDGVIIIFKRKSNKRRWRMLRIPESVACRVRTRMTKRGGK